MYKYILHRHSVFTSWWPTMFVWELVYWQPQYLQIRQQLALVFVTYQDSLLHCCFKCQIFRNSGTSPSPINKCKIHISRDKNTSQNSHFWPFKHMRGLKVEVGFEAYCLFVKAHFNEGLRPTTGPWPGWIQPIHMKFSYVCFQHDIYIWLSPNINIKSCILYININCNAHDPFSSPSVVTLHFSWHVFQEKIHLELAGLVWEFVF